MTACSFIYPGAELLKLICAVQKRDELNKYLFKLEVVANFLPHVNLEDFGRMGKSYSK